MKYIVNESVIIIMQMKSIAQVEEALNFAVVPPGLPRSAAHCSRAGRTCLGVAGISRELQRLDHEPRGSAPCRAV